MVIGVCRYTKNGGKLKRNVRTCLAAVSIATVLAAGAPGIANAADEAPAVSSSVSAEAEFQGFVTALALPSDAEAQVLENFDRLSFEEQKRISEDPVSALVEEATQTSTTLTPASNSDGVAARAVTYNVTSNATSPVSLLGVTVGEFRMTFRYVTGSNIVQRTTSCDSWFSGFAGFWNMSVQSVNHYTIGGGQAQCIARHNGSIVYKGSAFQMNKQMGMTVNGPGIVNWWLYNV